MARTCGRCETGSGKHEPTTPRPSIKQLERWEWDGEMEATDGCPVDPDSKCEHGHLSWLVKLGLM